MHTINDLREHLFETLEALLDKKNPMDVDRANAIANVAQAMVSSARAECHYLELVGGTGTGFIPEADDGLPTPRIADGRGAGKR